MKSPLKYPREFQEFTLEEEIDLGDNYSIGEILKGKIGDNNSDFDKKEDFKQVKLISDLKPNEEVQVEGKVISKRLQKTKSDRSFLLITLADKSQSIRAVDWYYPEDNNNKIQVGEVIKLKGKTVFFENRIQINVINDKDAIEILNPMEVNPEKYLRNSQTELNILINELENYIFQVKNVGIKSLLTSVFIENDYIREMFLISPAAMDIHHAYQSGLIEHSLKVTELSLKLYKTYFEEEVYINKDIIIAGSLLHDIGKIEEYVITPSGIEKTEQGELMGHIPLGVKLIYEEAKKIGEKIDKDDLEHIIHIILSHHGEIEYGSPVVPKTLEAMIINFSDNIDSKIARAKENIRNALQVNENSTWSEYDKRLERKMKIEKYND
jgi:3'-5' exoribonuclease